MARSDVVTQLELDRFAQILGIHPLHFNQVVAVGAESRTCGIPILQHSWQSADRTSREEISEAIYMAERQINKFLGYDIRIGWIEEELHNNVFDRVGFHGIAKLHTEKKRVVSGGKRTKVLVESAVAIVYTDTDSDGYKETATMSTVIGFTDSNELEIYYPNKGGVDEWKILSVSKDIVGNTGTIITRRERLVKEQFMEAISVETVEGEDDANFLDTVDVYRVYNDPSKQVDFIISNCCFNSCPICTFTVQSGCISVLHNDTGFIRITPANWDVDHFNLASCLTGFCDRVKLWYRAGFSDHMLDQAVSILALTYLDRPICSCENLEHITRWWCTDLAESVAGRDKSVRFQISKGLLDNPFGTTRAAIRAWRIISG